MVILGFCAFYLGLALLGKCHCATHWVVTEKGMIQSHVGSPLELRRPYDLISLLDQEKRWNEIQTLLKDLLARKTNIEEKWSRLQGNTESKTIPKNLDCLSNGTSGSNGTVTTPDDFYDVAINGSDRFSIKLTTKVKKEDVVNIPECDKFSKTAPAAFSEADFPSLYARNVTFLPDLELQRMLPVGVTQYGHQVHRELARNASSWVHYNLAALYWRVKGDAQRSIDCTKKAFHFAPKCYKDVVLHNMAGILYRAGRAKESVLLLHRAIEMAPKQATHYLALGYIHLGLKNYNSSIFYYDKFLELKPEHEGIAAIKQVISCLYSLETQLTDIRENVLGYLEGILSDLHDFHSLQQHWLRLSQRLMWEHSSYDKELGNLQEEAFETVFGKKSQRCVKKSSTISCDFVHSPIADFDTLNLENLLQYVESEKQRINDRMTKNVEGIFQKFPTTMSTEGEKYFDATGWPSEEQCKKWNLPLNEKEDLKLPIFLPPENKGYEIDKILGEKIGLSKGVEHPLPWHPPVCDEVNSFGEKYVQQSERNALNNDIKPNEFLLNHFTKYVNGGKAEVAEIGQRIVTAIEKKAAPNWVLSTLASLFWRLRGNTKKSLDCLDLSLKSAPKEQTDVALISIGSIVNQLGLINQALKYANLAFKLNYVEPSTNFLLALLHYESNPLMAMYYMKNVLRVDEDFYDGMAEKLLKIWSCRIKLGTFNAGSKSTENKVRDVCSEKESSFKGKGMICSANGEDCKSASIQCFHTTKLEEGVIGKRSKFKSDSSISSTIEGSGDLEPDQSQLERVADSQPVHLRILLGEEQNTPSTNPEFYVGFSDDSVSDTILHVYDKSGTYPLSSQACKKIVDTDWPHFSSIWQTIAGRNLNVGALLKPYQRNAKKRYRPYCTEGGLNPNSAFLNQITSKILQGKLPNSPERTLGEWLAILTGDHKSTVDEIGSKIASALQENSSSWLLATAAAIYWRILGNAEEAIVCLRLSLNHVPGSMKDVPLNSLANLLQRFGFQADALDIAYLALKINPSFVVNHFTIGNILASMGDLEEAISFHRSALAIDSNFEPARNRLQAILCTLLFDESGTLRNIPEH